MKRKGLIITVVIILLMILVVPIPSGPYKDGGTRQYTALTYRVVKWKKISPDSTYQKTRIYFGLDCFKSIDTLWEKESDKVTHTFKARLLSIDGFTVTVEPLEDEYIRNSADKITFSVDVIDDIALYEGTLLNITYKGSVRESYPAQIDVVKWERITDS